MDRYKAIKIVGDEILKDGLVEALFLKGSIARGVDDDYSDVDMYAAVTPENREEFLGNRIQYMEKYLPMIYYTESNFVGPQIVGVFEDLLHFDLYTVDADNIPQTDNIKVIYDKAGILATYTPAPLGYSDNQLAKMVDSFAFTMLEYYIAHSRGDAVWAARLFSHQAAVVGVVARHVYDKDTAQLGLKGLGKILPPGLYQKLQAAQNMATLAKLLDELVPNEIRINTNQKFFQKMLEEVGK
ncbi:MAG: hypothetical protein FWE21_05105 [Defluviitaleaceae bacterium]|nr:hypothetical protein [Defluviitaleaceae bacterium]